ncbi:MAG: DUF402 domain-containing protein [Longimicrobiales bacterium]|nr:DUF402 domain-containing protein [Longimicrobiales bacterium]
MSVEEVRIHYLRPPGRVSVYVQRLVRELPEVTVTYHPNTPLDGPLRVEGRTVLEPGAPAVWFTFPGRWHDVGRFHDRAGRFTGIYANVITPCRPRRAEGTGLVWDTTDLFLDVWAGVDGTLRLLDEEEFGEAVARGLLTEPVAARARAEADHVLTAAAAGRWPPPVVREWTLERTLAELGLGD